MTKSHCVLEHDWFPAPVPSNITIGEGSWLYSSFAFLHCRSNNPDAVRIGRSCGVYKGCFFDLGPNGRVHLGDYTTLVGVIFSTNGSVRIGSYCFVAHEVVIADRHPAMPLCSSDSTDQHFGEIVASVTLGDDVWVGAGSVLLKGARVGNGTIIGAGTILDFEVPAYSIVAGNPARIIGSVPRAKTV